MLKSQLRKKYIEKRKTLSKDEVFMLSEKIFKNFILQFKPLENQKIHIFQSIEKFNEVKTQIFINYFFENNIRVFVPKITKQGLISVEINKETIFETNSWGIKEPKSNDDTKIVDYDFVITPLLYCDNKGNRVGYGKGYYDHFFSKLNKDVKKVGVSFFAPSEKIDDVSDRDVPLNYLVTPEEILSFKGFL